MNIPNTDIPAYCDELTQAAKRAAASLNLATGRERNKALCQIAKALIANQQALCDANALDLAAGKASGLSAAMLERLELNEERVASMAETVQQVADQPDPVGEIVEGRVLDSGIKLQKLRVPIGVILIIFESRPNVTCDAAALCLKAGNAVILRGGKEAIHTNTAIAKCVSQGIEASGLDPACVQLVETTDRAAVGELLQKEGEIDLCIPRGGKSLIRAVVDQARIPVIKHYTGNCHLYIDATCDPQMAIDLCINSKTQRTGVCNAVETILVHANAIDSGLLANICKELSALGVEVRGDARVSAAFPSAVVATDADWAVEYLDMIVAMRVVDSLEQTAQHINFYGSRHTDAIVTSDLDAAQQFVAAIDSANVFVNCSTRFSDGGQYGLGAEIGISTDKIHARGPMGASDLTTTKWVAWGEGQVRA